MDGSERVFNFLHTPDTRIICPILLFVCRGMYEQVHEFYEFITVKTIEVFFLQQTSRKDISTNINIYSKLYCDNAIYAFYGSKGSKYLRFHNVDGGKLAIFVHAYLKCTINSPGCYVISFAGEF